jgi:hypothetical protein
MKSRTSNIGAVSLKIIFLVGLFVFLLSLPTTAQAGVTQTDAAQVRLDLESEVSVPKLNLKFVSIVKEKTFALKVYNLKIGQTVQFASDDKKVVSVTAASSINGSCELVGIDFGATTVTVIVKEGNKIIAKLTCDVIVGPSAISVKFLKNEITLSMNQKYLLRTLLQPYNTVEDVKYVSLDSSIVKVSANGTVTAVSAGSTVIYALLDNQKFDTCAISVTGSSYEGPDEIVLPETVLSE